MPSFALNFRSDSLHLSWLVMLAINVAPMAILPARAETPAVKIAALVSRTGPGGAKPRIKIEDYDDRSTDDGAREAAAQIVHSEALVVVGPGTTTSALAAGPVFGAAGLASIIPYAHGGGGEASPTTFRPVFSTREMGEALANNLRYTLGGTRAVVIFRDNGYGRPIAAGFRSAAERNGISADYRSFGSAAEAVEAARLAAADPQAPAIVLGMIDPDAAPVVKELRRQGAKSLLVGTSAIATDAFADNFAGEAEYQRDRGFFTDGIYAVSPMILDSGNADTLAFAERFRARYGREPRWEAAQGYDAARLGIAAARRASLHTTDLRAGRNAALAYLSSLDGPAHAVASLTGPL
jgi:ABC-type branched-subunit amino acid transport system substrate-binding protein